MNSNENSKKIFEYFKNINDEFYSCNSNDSVYDKLFNEGPSKLFERPSDNLPVNFCEKDFTSVNSNSSTSILPKGNEAEDFSLTNLFDEFWVSGSCNNNGTEIGVKHSSCAQEGFGNQIDTNFTEKSRLEEPFLSETFDVLPVSPRNLPGVEASVPDLQKSNTLKEVKSIKTDDDFKPHWSSTFDFGSYIFSDEGKVKAINKLPLKNDANFGTPDFDLDSFLSSPINEFHSNENDSINSKTNSDLTVQKPVVNELLNENTPTKRKKMKNEEEIDSNDEDEKWVNMFETALPSVLQEPKINRKIMQKIKAKSLIGLRRVKYAIRANTSVQSSDKSCGSETICFATHPAEKLYLKKCPKKDISKISGCIENSLEQKSFKTSNEVAKSNKTKNISTKTRILSSGSLGSNLLSPVSADAYISSGLPPIRPEETKKMNVTPWANMLPVSKSSSSTNSCKNKGQNIYAYQPVPQKVKKSLKNVKALSQNVKKNPKTGNNLINLKNIVKIEVYTKHPKKMVITKTNSEPFKSISQELKETGTVNDNSKALPEIPKLVDTLKRSVEGLPDYLVKKLCLPFSAVKRSFLTSSELGCIERQAQLLQLLKELKNAPHYCSTTSCDICKDVSMMELELFKLQNYSKEGIELINKLPSSNSLQENSKGLLGCEKKKICNTIVTRHNPSDQNSTPKSTDFAKTSKPEEEEELCDGLMLYISDGGADPIVQTSKKMFPPLAPSLEKSRHWDKAMQYKKLSNIIKDYMQAQRKVTPSNDCVCEDNCRSFLACACASKVSVCADCSCTACENPFYAFEAFSIDLQEVKSDPCLLQTVYDIGLSELLELLNKECTTPCCNRKLKLYQIVPNVVECSHCGTFLSYSWCQKTVRNEKLYQRNHCAMCRKCQRPLRTHCFLCEICTLSCVSGKCLTCKEEKVYAGISLG